MRLTPFSILSRPFLLQRQCGFGFGGLSVWLSILVLLLLASSVTLGTTLPLSLGLLHLSNEGL